jgi:hypothetical protein
MRKLLMHSTSLDPIYICLSGDLRFHVVYQGCSMSSHNSIGQAVASAAQECAMGVSDHASDWKLLTLS